MAGDKGAAGAQFIEKHERFRPPGRLTRGPRTRPGDTCYLTGRVMSQSAYQREAAELALRAAEIATLLERYRGQPPTGAE